MQIEISKCNGMILRFPSPEGEWYIYGSIPLSITLDRGKSTIFQLTGIQLAFITIGNHRDESSNLRVVRSNEMNTLATFEMLNYEERMASVPVFLHSIFL